MEGHVKGDRDRLLTMMGDTNVAAEDVTAFDWCGKKSGSIFRGDIFLDFVRLTTRAEGPHGAHVWRANRKRIDRCSRRIFPLLSRWGSALSFPCKLWC